LYYIHSPDYGTPIDETLRFLDDAVHQGKILYSACSNFRSWSVCEGLWTSDKLGLARFAAVQPLYNLVNRDIEVELLPLCQSHGLGVVSYSPLARGILTAKYKPGEAFPEGSRAARNDKRMNEAELRDESLAISQQLAAHCKKKGVVPSQFALAWCLANPILTSIILGPRTMEQFDDNVGCLKVSIDEADEAFMRAQDRSVHGVAVQTFGGVEFERVIDTQHVGRADLGHHIGRDQHHDLVEPLLGGDLLRHGFAEPSQQDAGTSRRAPHLPKSSPAKPASRVAGSWRETHEKQQFYSFGAAASP
jgi:diketogulonate reductase-like aldo/keto reductase